MSLSKNNALCKFYTIEFYCKTTCRYCTLLMYKCNFMKHHKYLYQIDNFNI